MHEHPVTLVVGDDLRRTRLTVFFRLLLAIPHFVWFVVWSVVVLLAAIVGWIAALATGRLPLDLHRMFCSYIRYAVHLTAYLTLVADPYPGFGGEEGVYPVDVRLPDPEPQARSRTAVRLLLAIPALAVSAALGGGSTAASSGSSRTYSSGASGLSAAVAVLGWFASLWSGRMPHGLRDAGAYATGYRAQTLAYLLLVTARYPNADPTAMLAELPRPPVHPVHLVGDADDLRRSRMTVLFRLPLAIPHIVWLALWSVVAVLASIVQWAITLLRGRPAESLHAFLTRYVRYGFHVYAFLFLVANPFPGFAGLPGLYPLDIELPAPGRQNRWKTAFRILLAIPALAVNSALAGALVAAAVLTWFAALLTGSAPWGLRNMSAYALRYQAQADAYVLMLTDVYPYASPLEGSESNDAFAGAETAGEAA